MIPYSQFKALLKDERLPAVIVDLDAFDRNLVKLAEISRSSTKNFRVATKSLRVPALLARILKQGAPCRGLMCYSAEEIEALATEGFDDFLLAYPVARESELKILRRVHDSGKKITLVVDSVAGIELTSTQMSGVSRPFSLAIDVDASLRLFGGLLHLGVRRSPVRTAQAVRELLIAAKKYPEIRITGAMVYEAQVAGLGDRNPFKKLLNPIAQLVRKVSVRSVAKLREQIAETFKNEGVALELFNGGGSGSFNYAAQEKALTELTAGSGLLCSHLFDYYSNIQFEPACFFALEAVRSSDTDHVTCLGGGYIASGEPGWDRLPVPVSPEGLTLVSTEGCGEVQTPLKMAGNRVEIGDPVLFRPAKAGELAEHFKEYLFVSNGKIVTRAPTYRGLGHCFF